MSAEALIEELPLGLPLSTNMSGIDPTSSNPWNRSVCSSQINLDFAQTSFRDLMSEDLAKDLQIREEENVYQMLSVESKDHSPSLLQLESTPDTSSDLTLAYMLQKQYYKEYDSQIEREEQHLNKNSKLSISFNKYKVCPEIENLSSDEDYEDDLDDENRVLDSFEERQRTDPVIPPCGYIRHNDQIITKHDRNINGRKNAERIMNFPPSFNTGDGGGFEMQLSNSVYNKLQRVAQAESKRKQRVKDKSDKATTDKVLDPKTRLIVFKLVNNSILESVNGIISTGKESVVFHAQGGSCEEMTVPAECAIKVFKSHLTDFKTRERYIKNDYRFKDRFSKNNNKKMIQLWAEKEFHNLRRLQKAGIPSPNPILIKKHVLLMSFIGENQAAALKLKHVRLSFADWCIAYEQVVDIMVKMFHACKLVHGDMSEFNILWYNDQCWVIDLGQAVEPRHPHALQFLLRDCSNIIGFFKSKGLTDLPSPLQLFEKITGIGFAADRSKKESAEKLVEEYELNQELWREGFKSSNDHFEYLWKEIKRDEESFHLKGGKTDDLEDDLQEDILESTEEASSERLKRGSSKKNKSKRKNNKQTSQSREDEGLASDVSINPELCYSQVSPSISRTIDHTKENEITVLDGAVFQANVKND